MLSQGRRHVRKIGAGVRPLDPHDGVVTGTDLIAPH
jgi:hypothetical protein